MNWPKVGAASELVISQNESSNTHTFGARPTQLGSMLQLRQQPLV